LPSPRSAQRPYLVRILVAASAFLTPGLAAQASALDSLAVRFARMSAVSGYEQAVGDSLAAWLHGSTRDASGNVILVLGQGAPRRLLACPIDEVGYAVGGVTPDGYLTLRRIGRAPTPLFDQELEGERVTVFGAHGPVPGVVTVRSIHLTRDRTTPPDTPFMVDDAFVDIGARDPNDVGALGVSVLAPVTRTKQPILYGMGFLAGPVAGRRSVCAAVLAAARSVTHVKGTVVVAFTVQSVYGQGAGLRAVQALQGPFTEVNQPTLPVRFADTAVETVSLASVATLERSLEAWLRAP
jgi:putative aminopeptidase FrvX